VAAEKSPQLAITSVPGPIRNVRSGSAFGAFAAPPGNGRNFSGADGAPCGWLLPALAEGADF
jgi:hypothetical protein